MTIKIFISVRRCYKYDFHIVQISVTDFANDSKLIPEPQSEIRMQRNYMNTKLLRDSRCGSKANYQAIKRVSNTAKLRLKKHPHNSMCERL